MKKYRHKITHKEIQDLEYDILKEFDKFAKKNGLKYFLSGGSCLGAVRHQDFIPWDDDIDICMLRDDYEKLIKLVKDSRILEGRPELQFCLPLDDNYVYPFMKIVNRNTIVYEKDLQHRFLLGVWLDIFPMDVWPDDKKELRRIMRKHNFYKTMNKVYVAGNLTTGKKKVLGAIGKTCYRILFPGKDYRYWNKKIVDLVTPCRGTYIGDRIWPVADKEFFSKSVFEKAVYVKFRDREFPIPIGYKEYLTKMYGNYMKLPPEKDRIYHDFEAYIK